MFRLYIICEQLHCIESMKMEVEHCDTLEDNPDFKLYYILNFCTKLDRII